MHSGDDFHLVQHRRNAQGRTAPVTRLDFWVTWGIRERDRRGFSDRAAGERFAQKQANTLGRLVSIFDCSHETEIGAQKVASFEPRRASQRVTSIKCGKNPKAPNAGNSAAGGKLVVIPVPLHLMATWRRGLVQMHMAPKRRRVSIDLAVPRQPAAAVGLLESLPEEWENDL